MKRKKLAWLIPVLIILGILIVYLIVAMTLPEGLGPIEPFLNLGDLFTKSDGTTRENPPITKNCMTAPPVRWNTLAD